MTLATPRAQDHAGAETSPDLDLLGEIQRRVLWRIARPTADSGLEAHNGHFRTRSRQQSTLGVLRTEDPAGVAVLPRCQP